MNKTVMTLLSAPILIAMLILGMNTKASASGMRDVVIIGCGVEFEEPPLFDLEVPPSETPEPLGYEVNNWSNSAGASDVLIDSNCAQSLANACNAGFKIQRVKGNQGEDLNYILIRKQVTVKLLCKVDCNT